MASFTSGGALAADAGPSLTVLNPDDIRPGDTAQSIHVAGESLTEPTTLVVDCTPLVDAGVDLSNASVAVSSVSEGVDAAVDLRRADGALLRVTLDLSTLGRANVSIRDATVETSVALPARGVTVRAAERRGATVRLVVASRTPQDRIAIALSVAGIDTRGATPTTGLRYPITATAAAGSTTVESEPFGLYRPGKTPSPTPTPVPIPDGADADDPSPRTTGDGAGFGVGAWIGAVLTALALRRAGRA